MAPFKLNPGDKSYLARIVGNRHVGEPDRDVAEWVGGRCAKAKINGAPATAAQCRAIVRYAVGVHQKNRGDYRAVMSGRFGGAKKIPDGSWPPAKTPKP